MTKNIFFLLLFIPFSLLAQTKSVLTPETLWKLGNTGFVGQSPDGKKILYRVSYVDLDTEKRNTQYYVLDLLSGQKQNTELLKDKNFVQWDKNGLYAKDKNGNIIRTIDIQNVYWDTIAKGLKEAETIRISPNGELVAFSKHVLVEKVLGKDLYPWANNNSAQIYTELNHRHWDTWYDGKVSHLFIARADNIAAAIDIMEGQPYNTPLKPFGGIGDYIFSPDSRTLVYVCKKKAGSDFFLSTNTDLYAYNISIGTTENLTDGMMGYDLNPRFSPDGKYLAWESMKRDGYEADKNDIIVMNWNNRNKTNLTTHWDETLDGGFCWSNNGENIYFNATIKATMQLFSIPTKTIKPNTAIRQITQGVHNVAGIHAQSNNEIIVSRTDMNHAAELFSIDLKNGFLKGLSKTNDAIYDQLELSKIELRMVTTTDNQQMGVWVIYPPHFDPSKKYPTLLYCQGGPQSAVSQFYSTRWNFQLMAAQGYIVVAPNRRGLPGWGVKWNEDISGDWGGQPMKDYLAAIDDVSREPYVDNKRLGAVGASYGGYSVFMLAGIHEGRFKSFISHCGLFDMKSWYGTTEELFFANWDLKGSYWQVPQPKSYTKFDPSNYVNKWTAPILIIQGGLDYRVPTEQGLEAFKAAKLRGLKSKFLYFPDENHWILKPHNGMVWQTEFFNWLKETL